MSITITLDADDMRNTLFLRATAAYLAQLGGIEPKHTFAEIPHSVLVDIGATAGDTGAIRDDENEQVGVDADRPNVVPDTADAETLPTVPEVIPDIFGKASAPSVPVVPSVAEVPDAATLASGVDLDAQGLPWDARIHAATKSKVADGSWRALRGVDPAIVPVVEAELRALMAVPVPHIVSSTTQADEELLNGVHAASAPHEKIPAPPVPDVPEAPSTLNNSSNTPDAMPFPEFVQWMMATIKSGALTMAQANEAIVSVGLKGLPELTVRKDLVPAVKAAIEAML